MHPLEYPRILAAHEYLQKTAAIERAARLETSAGEKLERGATEALEGAAESFGK